MILKKFRKSIAWAMVTLGFVCLSSIFVGVAVLAENATPELTTTTVDFSDTYYRGDLFEVPEMKFTLGEKTVVATTEVESPSGKKFTSKQFYLDSRGKYNVRYSAEFDGKQYNKNESFEVDLKLFETSGGEKEVEASVNPYYEAATGQLVTLSYGGVFYYNQAIDVSQLSSNFIVFYVVPEVRGVADIKSLSIQLFPHFKFSSIVPENKTFF